MSKTSNKNIRVLLADDHSLIREGIRSSLRRYKHLEIVGEAADGKEALRQAHALLPDIVLMDINMPGLSGLEATEALRQQLPQVKILILTVHSNKEYVLRIALSGARGYVLKDTSPSELAGAIEAVHQGGAFFSPEVAGYVVDEYVAAAATQRVANANTLSERERQVLGRIAEGLTNKEIATRLGLGVRTVETHRERIMQKLGIRTVAGLTKFAIANGLSRLD
jgi:two-component system, NarL family, nitrate/nitrite response regulator NarL